VARATIAVRAVMTGAHVGTTGRATTAARAATIEDPAATIVVRGRIGRASIAPSKPAPPRAPSRPPASVPLQPLAQAAARRVVDRGATIAARAATTEDRAATTGAPVTTARPRVRRR